MHALASFLRTLDRRPRLVLLLLAAAGSALLLLRLSTPGEIIFDEVYYVEDARSFLAHGVDEGFAVHPPVGKWGIAASMALFGDWSFGWRGLGAMAAITTVLLTYVLTRRLLRAGERHDPVAPGGDVAGVPGLALLAPVLLLVDGLFIVQARTAMLDIFLLLFSTTALVLLVVDHDRRTSDDPPRRWRPSLRVLAGVALGLAVGTKWSGLLTVGAAGLLTIGWELSAARAAALPDQRWRWLTGVPRRAAAVLGSLLLVPAIVYGLTWAPWLAGFEHSYTATRTECGTETDDAPSCPFTPRERLAGLVKHHRDMVRFHLNLEATHAYRSSPSGFVVLERPVVYYWETCSADRAAGVPTEDKDTGELVTPDPCVVDQGDAAEMLAVGNPATWWGFLLLLPVLVTGAVRRDRRSAVVLVGWLALWSPWLLVSRTAFLFYMVPTLPLLATGIPVAIAGIASRRSGRAYVGAGGGAALAALLALVWRLTEGGLPWRGVALAGGGGWLLGAALAAVGPRGTRPAATTAHDPFAAPDTASAPDEASTLDEDVTRDAVAPGEDLAGDAHADGASTVVTLLDEPLTLREVAGTARRAGGSPRAARALAITFLVVAVGLFVWFAPVWLAIPMEASAVRMRWWFPTWI